MSNYVKLTSSEGAEFFVHRDCANVSQTISAMLSGEYSKRGVTLAYFLLFFLCILPTIFTLWLRTSTCKKKKKEERTERKQNIISNKNLVSINT